MMRLNVRLVLNMRVLAIDPGYDRLGVAVLERSGGTDSLLHSECVTTDRALSSSARLKAASDRLAVLIETHRPTHMALERLYFNRNRTTAMGVAEVRGAILFLGESAGCKIVEFTPQQVKVAVTGYGKSDKAQVAAMLPRLLHNVPKTALDDEYDAIAVGLTALVSQLST